jgi:hypothetical protein
MSWPTATVGPAYGEKPAGTQSVRSPAGTARSTQVCGATFASDPLNVNDPPETATFEASVLHVVPP